MSMESGKQQRDPTSQDLQDLRVNISGFGTGETRHKIDNILSRLGAALALAKKKGWNERYLQTWNESVTEINQIIAKRKQEQAKEKGLL